MSAKNDPVIERLIRWPAQDEPGTFMVRCSCLRWSATGTAAEIAAASRAHDDSPRRNHLVSIYGRIIDNQAKGQEGPECPSGSAATASSSTTPAAPEPCAAPTASQQQPSGAMPAPTPPPAATAHTTSNSAASSSSDSNPASHAPDADNPSRPQMTPTSATPTASRDTAASSTRHATGPRHGKITDEPNSKLPQARVIYSHT